MIYRFQDAFSMFIEKTHEKRRVLDTLFSLVGINIFLAGLSFVTTLFVANILGPERFGDLSYAIAVGGYCVTIACCGLEHTLVRDLVHFPKRFDEYVSANIFLRGSMLVVALIVILGVNALAKEVNQLGMAGIIIVLVMGIKALYIAPVYDAWDKMKRHALYLLVERCLYFICIWTLVLLFRDRLSVATISIFMIVSTSVGFILQYLWAIPRLNVQMGHKCMSLATRMLKRNLWVWIAILATLSFGGLSKIVLKHVSGSEELGKYAVAWQVVLLGSILITQVGRVGNPRIARIVQPDVSQVRRIRFLLQYTVLSSMTGAVIGLPAICFPSLILKIFRPEYVSAATSLRILGGYIIVVGIGQVATQYILAVRKERIYFMVVILAGSLSIVFYIILIPRWLATGAALAVLMSHGIAIAVYLAIMIQDVLTYSERKYTKPPDSLEMI